MGCHNSKPFSFELTTFFNNQCFDCEDNGCGANIQNARCVLYSGPNLSCSGIQTNDSVELALQKIDGIICSVTGDYSNYQFHCLDDWFGSAITQESQFVSAITEYACEIRGDLDFFINTTFSDYQTQVDERFLDLGSSSIACATAGVAIGDSLQVVLQKYCTKFEDIDDELDLSSVVWDNCFTVSTPPTNIAEGFTTVLDQICQLSSGGGVLPTFNNLGTCLSTPTSNDTLELTVIKIRERLCRTPTFDKDNITWGCVNTPTFSSDTDIESAIQQIVTDLSALKLAFPAFDNSDFTITQTDGGDPCQGITVALAVPSTQDRFVASTASDASPGTLQDKLIAGPNVTLDYITTPGSVIIDSTGTSDHKVLADTVDDTPGYLDQKMQPGAASNGVTITITYNGTDKKVDVGANVDAGALLDVLLTILETDSTRRSRLCAINDMCSGGGGGTPSGNVINTSSADVTIVDLKYGGVNLIYGGGQTLPIAAGQGGTYAYPSLTSGQTLAVQTLGTTATQVAVTDNAGTQTQAYTGPGIYNFTLTINPMFPVLQITVS